MNIKKSNEIHYQILKMLSKDSDLTQRLMAKETGLSLGKFNYCLKELVKKGFVKIRRFKSSKNKAAYMYILTPQGIEEKAIITARFLRQKIKEYEDIKEQIQKLVQDIEAERLN